MKGTPVLRKDRSSYFFRDYGWLTFWLSSRRFAHLPAVPDIQGIPDRQKVRDIIYQIVPFPEPGRIGIIYPRVNGYPHHRSRGFLVLQAERAAPSTNILTAGDAIWWAYVTITTVGYGDRFPVTIGGRLVGIMVMTNGVAVFATFAGLISSKLLASPAKDDEEKEPEVDPFEKQVITGMDEIKSYMSQQESKNQEISARLVHLENTLKTDK